MSRDSDEMPPIVSADRKSFFYFISLNSRLMLYKLDNKATDWWAINSGPDSMALSDLEDDLYQQRWKPSSGQEKTKSRPKTRAGLLTHTVVDPDNTGPELESEHADWARQDRLEDSLWVWTYSVMVDAK